MTVDVATPDESRMTRARRAFRRWRKSRPFWGGLLLILAGVEIFYSGNLNLGNIQIHLGLNGFKSYIIPLVVVLCGALTWATPAQRMFYGIIGTAAAVYSVVSVNLGGFIIGLRQRARIHVSDPRFVRLRAILGHDEPEQPERRLAGHLFAFEKHAAEQRLRAVIAFVRGQT